MAAVQQTIADFPGGSVSLSWDDVTLVYSQIAWTVSSGTLSLVMSQPGKITSTNAALKSDGTKNLSVLGLTVGVGGKSPSSGATFNLNWQP